MPHSFFIYVCQFIGYSLEPPFGGSDNFRCTEFFYYDDLVIDLLSKVDVVHACLSLVVMCLLLDMAIVLASPTSYVTYPRLLPVSPTS